MSKLKSNNYKLLLDAASEVGVKKEDILVFLWLLNFPQDLLAIKEISENISEILVLIERKLPKVFIFFDMQKWKIITEWIIRNNFLHSKNFRKNPYVGKCSEKFPLQTLLFCCHEYPELRERYHELQALFLLRSIQMIRRKSTIDMYENTDNLSNIIKVPVHNPASRGLRELSVGRYSGHLDLITVELKLGSVKKIAKKDKNNIKAKLSALTDKDFDELNIEEKESLRILPDLVSLCNFLINPGRRKKETTRECKPKKNRGRLPREGNFLIKSSIESLEVDLGNSDDLLSSWGSQTLVQQVVIEGETVDEGDLLDLVEQDIHPGEVADTEELVLSDTGCDNTKKWSRFNLTAKNQARYATMANQNLVNRYDLLSITELANVLTGSSKLFRVLSKQKQWTEDEYLKAECIALIHVMLWTGSILSRSLNIKVIEKSQLDKNGFNDELGVCSYSSEGKKYVEWLIKPYRPDYLTEYEVKEGERKHAEYIRLPDIAGGSVFFFRLLKRKRVKSGSLIFNKDIKEYRREIKVILEEFDSTGRTTVDSISKYFFKRIKTYTNDSVLSTSIFGKEDNQSRVRVFYSTPNLLLLRNVYIEHVSEVADAVYEAVNIKRPSFYTNIHPDVDEHTGCRYCPTTEHVRGGIESLLGDVKRCENYKSFDEFIKYHNSFTLYTVLLLFYASGCRAIISPFIQSKSIDLPTGITVLSDKGKYGDENGRPIKLVKDAIEQILIYEAHRNNLVAQYGYRLTFRKKGKNRSVPECFFIDPNSGSWKEVSESTIEEVLKEYLAYKANTHRRYIRTTFLEESLYPENYDALLGHACRGEEQWGAFSTFSYSEYFEFMERQMPGVLKELGFVKLHSVLANTDLSREARYA